MADELDAIFEKNLRLVDNERRRVFVEKMREYRERYMFYQANDMNYVETSDYINDSFCVSVVDRDDYWVYSPQFNKTMGLTLSKLFRTKITYVGCGFCLDFERIVFVDQHKNRWLMCRRSRESEPDKVYVTLRMPRPRTNLALLIFADDSTVLNAEFRGSFLVEDASKWHED